MSRKLWVWVSYYFEGVHRKVALERLLLTALQRYLRRQRSRAHLVGEDPHHPRTPLHFLEQPLQHVRRAYPGVVTSGITQVGRSASSMSASKTETASTSRLTSCSNSQFGLKYASFVLNTHLTRHYDEILHLYLICVRLL